MVTLQLQWQSSIRTASVTCLICADNICLEMTLLLSKQISVLEIKVVMANLGKSIYFYTLLCFTSLQVTFPKRKKRKCFRKKTWESHSSSKQLWFHFHNIYVQSWTVWGKNIFLRSTCCNTLYTWIRNDLRIRFLC